MRLALLLALALAAVPALAQTPDDSTAVPADSVAAPDLDATFEALLEDDADGDPTELLERIADLRESPLDVNTATADDLGAVPAFSPLVAAAIVRTREADGPFTSLPGLRSVPGVTADVFLAARPYLTIGPRLAATASRGLRFPRAPRPAAVLAGLQYQATQRVQRRLDTQAGYVIGEGDSAAAFAGSPERIYTRLTATYGRQVSVNVTLEKDPGEAFGFGANTLGYDYTSAHAALLNAGRIEALVVGDFVAEFGQGVALWRASGFGKGPDAVGGPVRSGRGLRPYGSVDETNFFRGAALAVRLTPGVTVSAFASRRALDATIDTLDVDLSDPDLPPDVDAGAVVSSLGTTGLHRTPGELARENAVRETLVGGAVEGRYTSGRLVGKLGVVATQSRFDTPLAAGPRPDQRFAFSGDAATTVSVYGEARTRTLSLFGEGARGAGGGLGGVAGLGADVGGGTEVLLVGRSYGRDFTSLHGYPFGERNGIGQNERGLYAGVRLRPTRRLTLNAYVDQYRFPYLRFNLPRPSRGREALVTADFRPRRYLRGYIQARTETREVGVDAGNVVPGSTVGGLAEQTRQTLRVQAEWDASRTLRFRARVEGSRAVEAVAASDPRPAATTGALVYQDVRVQARPWLRVDTRLTLFRTDSFDSRLYAFENDLTGVFSIPALSGRGVRGYVLVAAEPVAGLVVQAKIASTWLRGVNAVGSGTSRVQGDRVRDVGVQVRYRF